MNRNDYRRALILLRPLRGGYSGHVRLERRTLAANLFFQVQSPVQEPVRAVLAGAKSGRYYAADLGPLRRDSRGQAVLSTGFDPRNIQGHDLEDFRLIVLVRDGDGELLMTGNLAGSFEADLAALRRAILSLLFPESDIAPEPTVPEEPKPEEPAPEETVPENPFPGVEVPEFNPVLETEPAPEPVKQVAEPQEESTPAIPEEIAAAWPDELSAVRALFAMSPRIPPVPGLEDYSFVSAPMPDGSAFSTTAIGVRAEDGAIRSICYAFPAAYSPEPPPGLEDYEWRGTGLRGWWMNLSDFV